MTDRKYPLNGTHYTSADDLEMLSHPEDWPAVLHVKRRGAERDLDEFGTVEVYPMTAVPKNDGIAVTAVAAANVEVEDWPDAILVRGKGDTPTSVYKDAATMVEAGWMVD